jgi:hypothetical protein
LGKQSGSQAVAHILTEAGVPVDREQARELLPLIRELSEATGGTVSPTVAAAKVHRRTWRAHCSKVIDSYHGSLRRAPSRVGA